MLDNVKVAAMLSAIHGDAILEALGVEKGWPSTNPCRKMISMSRFRATHVLNEPSRLLSAVAEQPRILR